MASSMSSSPVSTDHDEACESYTPVQTTRGTKRRCCEMLTPPVTRDDQDNVRMLERAVHVLNTEATALSQVTRLYETDPLARESLTNAVDCVARANELGGKLIICGIGKSGLVGMKTVATMKSLGLGASFLHAAEAMHGDLGDIRYNDAIMFVTYSGQTGELLQLLPHISAQTQIIVLTSHLKSTDCAISIARPDAIILPAPIHEPEEVSFGVRAPTTSTTVAIAVGDMLALSTADRVHEDRTKGIFTKNHPGGTIGVKARKEGL